MSKKDRWHRGLHARRLDTDTRGRELAFAEEWEDENRARRWLNFGHGTLQDLMMVDRRDIPKAVRSLAWWANYRPAFIIKRRDAVIAATVIQWLGSNCGFAFVEKCLNRCGYRIVRVAEPDLPLITRATERDMGRCG